MMIKHPEQRVAVFIDTQNMYYSARNLFGARVNFKSIVEAAVGGRKLTRAIAYVVSTKTGEEKPFFEALNTAGIETKEKELQVYGGMKKADWDVGIAVDAIKLAEKVDAIVLVSGDGDFGPLVEYLRGVKGCLVEVASFRETTSSKLLELVDDYIDLSKDPDRYLMRSNKLDRNNSNSHYNGNHTHEDERPSPPSRGRGAVQKRKPLSFRDQDGGDAEERTGNVYPIITPWS